MNRREINEHRDQVRQRVTEYLTDPRNVQDVLQALEICDGHSIFEAQEFNMLPEFVRDHFSKVCASASPSKDPKGVIYTDDGAIDGDLFGIYRLDVIEAVARAHDVSSAKNGRGFRANDLKEKLRSKLQPERD